MSNKTRRRRDPNQMSAAEKMVYYDMCMDEQGNVRFIQEVPAKELQGLMDLPDNEFVIPNIRAELARRVPGA